jgi:hypothetical protein
MHTDVSYKNRLTPAFDAVEDVKNWFGPERWETISPVMAVVKDVQQFCFYAEFGGVKGFPVKAWYELYQGQGSWDKAWAEIKNTETDEREGR